MRDLVVLIPPGRESLRLGGVAVVGGPGKFGPRGREGWRVVSGPHGEHLEVVQDHLLVIFERAA